MRNMLIALMLIAVADLDAIAQTTDETPEHVKVESQGLSSPPSPVHPSMSASITHNARDCDGQSSMKDSVTALIVVLCVHRPLCEACNVRFQHLQTHHN